MRRIPIIAGSVLGSLGLLLVLNSWLVNLARAGTLFSNSGQTLGTDTTYDLDLGDVDGDGDLDLVTGNLNDNVLWLNNGNGIFQDSGDRPGSGVSEGITFGDLNGDLSLDIYVANDGGANQVWLNDGSGAFTWDGQAWNPAGDSQDVELVDIDQDGDLDAFVANHGPNSLWLNDGAANFVLTQSLAMAASNKVVIGDVDGDLDPDVYVANGQVGFHLDELWLNENGRLVSSGQTLSGADNEGAALGDLDGDQDLDLFLATWFLSDTVWLNDGQGTFTDSGQQLSSHGSLDVQLTDVDDDGDLDAIVAKWAPDQDEIWLNDGSGNFTLSGESLDAEATYSIAIGDLDGDNDADLVFANFNHNEVWFKGGVGLPQAWLNVPARVNPAGQAVYPWAQSGDAVLPVVLDLMPHMPLDVLARLDSPLGVTTDTISFAIGQTSDDLTIPNPQVAPSQAVTITLSVEATRAMLGLDRHNPLKLIFIDQGAGDQQCFLCYADWLVKLLGFETSFWAWHHMQLTTLRGAPSWDFYQSQFGYHTEEMTQIVASNPRLLWQTFDTLESWTPAVQSIDAGQAQNTPISPEMVDDAMDLFTGIQAEASPVLASQIQHEIDILDFPSLAGETMAAAVDRIESRLVSQTYLPVVGTR